MWQLAAFERVGFLTDWISQKKVFQIWDTSEVAVAAWAEFFAHKGNAPSPFGVMKPYFSFYPELVGFNAPYELVLDQNGLNRKIVSEYKDGPRVTYVTGKSVGLADAADFGILGVYAKRRFWNIVDDACRPAVNFPTIDVAPTSLEWILDKSLIGFIYWPEVQLSLCRHFYSLFARAINERRGTSGNKNITEDLALSLLELVAPLRRP